MAQYAFYVGYRKGDTDGGIIHYMFDSLNGFFSVKKRVFEGLSPSYLATSPVAGRIACGGTTEHGTAVLLLSSNTNGGHGSATLCHVPAAGFSHISFSADGGMLLATDYGQGLVQAYRLEGDGLRLCSEVKQTGSGPNALRQESSHPHSIFQSRKGGWVAVSDLGADSLTIYTLDPAGILHRKSEWAGYPEIGPRHVEFHPDGTRLYLLCELTADILLFALDARGNLMEKQRASALQPDFAGYNLASEVRLSPDGRFLYAANRGGNSLVRFVVGMGGLLTEPVHIPTRGWPREFLFTQDGSHLLVLNEEFTDSLGELEAFRVDRETGLLTNVGAFCSLPGAYTMALAGTDA